MKTSNQRRYLKGAAATALALAVASSAVTAQEGTAPILFTNAHIFDGTSPDLSGPMSVLIEGNTISSIAAEITAPEGATVIDAGGDTLMPGLTDCHWHTMQANTTNALFLTQDLDYIALEAAVGAEKVLMRGFTTLRDMGGPVFGLKKLIDNGTYVGPRIYPSGSYISQTSGHADFRSMLEVPRDYARDLTAQEQRGMLIIADGKAQVMQRARENLMKGAVQLKAMAGGGVASPSDPLDVAQFTQEELHAIVEVAENWNTYVSVHAYSAKAVQHALAAGVKSIEHGLMIDEETAQMVEEADAWICMQPILNDEDAIPMPDGSFEQQKFFQLTDAVPTAYELAKQYDLKVGFGTDTQNWPELQDRQGAQLAKLTRWFEPWEVLRMATSQNYEMFKMVGPRDPYPGKNGVIEEGALADILLVDGNPLEDINLIADPEANFVVIMKDGVIYKNTLEN
ncbi:amidohydrolase family protein [Sedimentitalea sp. JM2-8]|uniref:Amidohydrolase family protein n=1 Tax=Sedimentitalea xiamensis TaxID=3050037 RepID=A0ABT7FK83_9RHOB|nr:amidohydrolase family protein [Sedimentitalea xiamensis]MDK3075566.1 amidohydrolase family protein [Sedimentitalea xiamensis]